MKTPAVLFFCLVCAVSLAGQTNISDITSSQVWDLSGSPYIVSGTHWIYNNATVTIEAGVQVRFNSGAGLILGSYSQGNIIANGTQANPIVFTANTDTPSAGFWQHIQTTGYCWDTVFNHCVFEYGGASYGNIYMENGDPEFHDCVFSHSLHAGLYCDIYSSGTMTVANCLFSENGKPVSLGVRQVGGLKAGNQYVDNTDNRVHCLGGSLNANSTWTAQAVPIYFTAGLEGGYGTAPVTVIPSGSILEFAAGTRVYLASGDVLQATGATFRGEQPTPGFWKGFYFYYNAGNSLLSGCTIRDAGYDSHAALHFENPASIITGCTITNCAAKGIWMTYNCLQSISATSISGCGSYPLSIIDESVRVLGEGNSFSGNDLNMVEVRPWDIRSSGIWRDPGVPYLLTGNLDISEGSVSPHIRIQPGAVIMLSHQTRIVVGSSYGSTQGSLEAEGVVFTRSDPAAVPYGLYFYYYLVASQCVFTDCVFEYLGQSQSTGAVHVLGQGPTFNGCVFRDNPYSAITTQQGGKVTATNCAFTGNGYYPIRMSAIDFDSLSGAGCTYSGNNPNRILVSASSLDGAKTYVWNNPGLPVEVSGEISVSGSGAVPPILKLNSGLVILVSGNWLRIGSVYGFSPGGIQAEGVTFSSASGSAGGWNGLYLDYSVTSDSYLRNCVLEYASQANILNAYSTLPVIESCIIRNGATGIWLQANNGTPSIIRNHIMDNGVGVQCDGNSSPVIGGSLGDANSFSGNTTAVQNSSSSVTVNAEYNWWGNASGPTHSGNPGGEGDPVSNYVDYDPWRTNDIGDAPARFNLLLPANYSVLETLTPLLDWQDAIDPTPGDQVTYKVQLSPFSDFSAGLIEFQYLTASFKQVPASILTDDTRYYWRVIATDSQAQSTYNYEPNFYFDTAVPEAPQAFDPLSPDYNTTVSFTSNLLVWEEAVDPDAGDLVTYTVYQDISAGFENPHTFQTPNTYGYSGFCAPGSLIYWKVKATDLTNNETFSPTWRFFVDGNAKPRAPVDFTLTPSGSDILISWDAVPGADSYDIYFSTDPHTGFSLMQSGLISPSCLHVGAANLPRYFYYVTAHDTQ